MSYDPNNIFARILRGELPCYRIYEDEATLAFMDIMPQADGHALIIPKEPAVTLLELSPESAAATIRTTRKIARAVSKAFSAPGILIAQLNGTAAGQTVPHIHFHVLPRSEPILLRPHAAKMEDGEKLKAFAARIIAALEADA